MKNRTNSIVNAMGWLIFTLIIVSVTKTLIYCFVMTVLLILKQINKGWTSIRNKKKKTPIEALQDGSLSRRKFKDETQISPLHESPLVGNQELF